MPTGANTQPAFGCYLPDPDGTRARAAGILVLTIAGDRIGRIERFLDDRLPDLFGLAVSLKA